LLSGLVSHIESGEPTKQEAARMGVLMLVAGHETTANMIALSSLALLRHPDQLALLRASEDPRRVASAVEELLRYLSIIQNGRRRVEIADIEHDGQVIRAGEGVIFPKDIASRSILYVNLEECTSCTACYQPDVCPVGAIYSEEHLPDGSATSAKYNADDPSKGHDHTFFVQHSRDVFAD
jgi:NAD-dependent dihydropyrimidine dehydrogenase PreA subunit